jgi:glycosyltransferase involved in cell wall biosynthesis
MDDFPAGPTSPGPRRPPLSVVIPVRNGGRDFERCLRGLRDSSWTDFELVVVDDGSTDGSAELAASFGAIVVRHETPLGPAAARNAGAEAASAPLVFFLDADVVLHPDALRKAVTRFAADADLAALFGSYDDRPAGPGLVSRFRNLLHHDIHQQGDFRDGAREARTFWTGCGAIRRRVFLELGGFDPQRYRRPAIEDIELGYRMHLAGHRVMLVRDIQATHLKRWTLRRLILTDIFQRGVPWTLLMLRSRIAETDLNVSRSQRVCVAATGLGLLGLMASPWQPALLTVPLVGLATIVALNLRFYRFLARRQGLLFAIASIPLHVIYFGCCGLSVVIALALWSPQGWRLADPAQVLGATRPRDHSSQPHISCPNSSHLQRPSH